MNTIYLPVEICSRELMARAFLASNLANNGHVVYIFEHTFFDRNKWLFPGIYIGKNCFKTEVPYIKTYYKKMKECGVNVWHLDEEGGVYSGNIDDQRDILTYRLEARDLDEADKILTWGNWQKQVFDSKNPRAEVVVSGSPNFDIFQEKYKYNLKNWDLDVTGGRKDFILVNTRFSNGNPKMGVQHRFNKKQPDSGRDTEFYMEEAYIANNKLLFGFIELCIYLARELPDTEIVIRPHPSESHDIYKILTKKLHNICVTSSGGVESWIRMSKVLIHNGCTTAIQSIVAKQNVVTYIPNDVTAIEDKFTAYLPNTIGRIAHTHDDVLSFINKPYFNQSKIWMDTVSRLDSIEYISELVNREPTRSVDTLFNSKYRLFLREKMKDVVMNGINYMTPNRKHKRFNYKEFSKIVDLVEIANKHYKSNVKYKKITNGCYCIYK